MCIACLLKPFNPKRVQFQSNRNIMRNAVVPPNSLVVLLLTKAFYSHSLNSPQELIMELKHAHVTQVPLVRVAYTHFTLHFTTECVH